ncbi:MAG TPA: molybdopterin-binding protein [Desulfomonilaceae bacterium]|nr:molybdopterin-binding protein [Desulfomonilaceae bacterium]
MPENFACKMQLIDLADAVGMALAHDITEIRPGEFKGAAFKKGQILTQRDLDHLARLGKRHLYVVEIGAAGMHEDEAAVKLAEALSGPGITFKPKPCEGKISLFAARDGLLKVNVGALTDFNVVDGIMCASIHNNTLVKEGDIVAATKAIPLVIERDYVNKAVAVARNCGGVFTVKELSRPRTGLIITGQEVYEGLIEDKFVDALAPKLKALKCEIMKISFAPDNTDFIAETVRSYLDAGVELIITTGGTSVDPDDVTRAGIIKAGAEDLLFGSSVMPGAMMLLASIKGVPVIGVPASGIFFRTTIFDLVLPRILAGEKITRRDLAQLAHGGMCLQCEECRYPICPFGKSA